MDAKGGAPMTTIQRRIAVVVAILLALSVAYFVGRRSQKVDDALAANAVAIKENTSKSSIDSAKVDTARRKSTVLDSTHDVVRNRIRVYRDTVYVKSDIPQDGGDSTQSGGDEAVYSPAIAHLIATDDSLISAQKHSLALQDTLIASLRGGIALRDTRIKLLESEVSPGKLKRFINATKWLAIGTVVGLAASHK